MNLGIEPLTLVYSSSVVGHDIELAMHVIYMVFYKMQNTCIALEACHTSHQQHIRLSNHIISVSVNDIPHIKQIAIIGLGAAKFLL